MSNGADLSGLDDFNVSSLLSGDKPPKDGVLIATIDKFQADKENSRTDFNEKKIQELADSMLIINEETGQPRGVLQPLSVIEDGELLIVAGGNRRLKAAKLAGLTELPYFIANDLNRFDKVVDNLQREGLNAKDLARFIKECLKLGIKAGDIAKKLSKPPSFVSDHSIYFEMSEGLKNLYNTEKCKSMQILASLHRASNSFPNEIEDFIQTSNNFGRILVNSFIKELKEKAKLEKSNIEKSITKKEPEPSATTLKEEAGTLEINEPQPQTLENPLVLVLHDEREASIQIQKQVTYGFVAIKYRDGGSELIVKATEINFIAVIEG